MLLQPLGSRVLVKRKLLKMSGGIYIPHNSKEAKFPIGEVLEVGEDCYRVNKGDVVTFGKYASMVVDEGELELYGIDYQKNIDHELLIINEEDILCVVFEETQAS